MRVQHHAVAAGLGLTYELLTGDLSQVNYSSIRAGLIEFRRRVAAMQRQFLIPQICQPVWDQFLATAQAAGLIGQGRVWVEWTPPRFEAVDPMKDIQGEILMIRAGLMSLHEGITRQGFDPDRVMDEIASANEDLDRLGIILDTDPRQVTRTGQGKTNPPIPNPTAS